MFRIARSPPALQDMVAGDIDYYCPLLISAIRLIENKSVKVLAVLTEDRSPLLPDLPTAREQGIDVTDGYYWRDSSLPKGTPEPIVDRAQPRGLHRDGLRRRCKSASSDAAATVVAPDRRSGAHLREYMKGEVPKWAAIMKANGVEQQ